MKTTSKLLLSMLALVVTLGSCRVYYDSNGHKIPPGQAKKMYGTQSAKPFAPGQQKKRH